MCMGCEFGNASHGRQYSFAGSSASMGSQGEAYSGVAQSRDSDSRKAVTKNYN